MSSLLLQLSCLTSLTPPLKRSTDNKHKSQTVLVGAVRPFWTMKMHM